MTISALIELNDSKVNIISLKQGGFCEVEFSQLYVFERVATEHYEGWSYRATLRLEHVSESAFKGMLLADDYVSDGHLFGPDGTDIAEKEDVFTTSFSAPCTELTLLFGSGAFLSVKADKASFCSVTRGEFVESRNGPLRSQV